MSEVETNVEAYKTQVFSKIRKGSSASVVVEEKEIPVSQVTITPNKEVNNVEVTVESLKNKPSEVASSPGSSRSRVYNYLSISSTEQEVEGQIRFKVNQTWIKDSDIDPLTIRFARYSNGEWEELPSTKYGANSNYLYYYANTTGFSYFSILADSRVEDVEEVEPEPSKPPAEQQEKPPSAPSQEEGVTPEGKKEEETESIYSAFKFKGDVIGKLSSYWYVFVAVLVFVLIAILANKGSFTKLFNSSIDKEKALEIAKKDLKKRGISLSKASIRKPVKEKHKGKDYWSVKYLVEGGDLEEVLLSSEGKVVKETVTRKEALNIAKKELEKRGIDLGRVKLSEREKVIEGKTYWPVKYSTSYGYSDTVLVSKKTGKVVNK